MQEWRALYGSRCRSFKLSITYRHRMQTHLRLRMGLPSSRKYEVMLDLPGPRVSLPQRELTLEYGRHYAVLVTEATRRTWVGLEPIPARSSE